ncbi:MAG: TonB-dependent receptor [Vicinamibacterales bacterium]
MRIPCVAVLLLSLSVIGTSAFAQARVRGRVVDATGSVLPGAVVELRGADRTWREATSDRNGNFDFSGLDPGRYAVLAGLFNFSQWRSDVLVDAGATANVEVTLHVSVSADITVTGRATFRNLADLERPQDGLVGIADAASQGAVTADQLEERPLMRAGELLETVPGLVISQHSGEGKANQYYLRGFNLDHGTDLATSVAGVPVNLPTHAHGHGYTDVNFLIPELVSGVQFRKGPYSAEDGDFATAGSVNVNYVSTIDRPLAQVEAGGQGWARGLLAASPRVGSGWLMAALEVSRNEGPWVRPDDYRKINGVLRYSRGDQRNGFSVTGMGYVGTWAATDQIPSRAIASGGLDRFAGIDDSAGGDTARYALSADFQQTSAESMTRATAYVARYRLNLFSNFTYFLDDPENGDQFEQADRRWIAGARWSQRRVIRFGGRSAEVSGGLQLRYDDIGLVGLYHTARRQRLSAVREDAVRQASAGAFVQSSYEWLPGVRTTVGLRADGYRFDVEAAQAPNRGVTFAGRVSPKVAVILTARRDTEIYANYGQGFHSNDARGATITVVPGTDEPADPVTPLVRARGAEVGIRTVAIPRTQSTLTLWRLSLASEQLFIGDAGTTEAGSPSVRYGLEWTNYVRLGWGFRADADLAWTRARFSDGDDLAYIPGALGLVAAGGVTSEHGPMTTTVRLRAFGARTLTEDASVMSRATRLVNAAATYRVTPKLKLVADVFNVFDSKVSDIDYFYASRLPGESADGVDDVHFHPALPRAVRLALHVTF